MSNTDTIKSFQRYATATSGTDQQKSIVDTAQLSDKLSAITELVSDRLVRKNLPSRSQAATVSLAQEVPRYDKRNVLPDYDRALHTYQAEIIDTTVPRLITHEPCAEHVPAAAEAVVDTEGKLQGLLSENNPESTDYTELRLDSSVAQRFSAGLPG